jgi:amino acid adenylation domain-containing protein
LNLEFQTLGQGLISSLCEYGQRPAVVVDGISLTYSELREKALATGIEVLETSSGRAEKVGILAARSAAAYIGIAAATLTGCTYVPLNPRFPVARLVAMLRASDSNILVVGEECADLLMELCRDFEKLTIICPIAGPKLRTAASCFQQHLFVFLGQHNVAGRDVLRGARPEAPAYLMFTSGTTGTPKGVPISNLNVCSYMRYTIQRYKVRPDDRFTQLFDLTFDLSVHDVFVSLISGASLHVVPSAAVMGPTKFVRDNELTMWFSVPSVPMFMSRMRMLKAAIFPTLRFALFCGEALPQRTAEMFQAAAPNAVVENLYGPTEATIAITNYRWNSKTSPGECVNGLVPIGSAFAGNSTKLIGADAREVKPGDVGEIYLSGKQVASGYLNDGTRTAERFVQLEDDPHTVWYRTGDLGREDNGVLVYLGRVDDQVQIRGFRVELQEIDHAIRTLAGTDLAIAVPQDLRSGCAESVLAVVQGNPNESLRQAVLTGLRDVLPDYMVPTEVIFILSLPLNANGKVDRKALTESLNAK